LPYRLHTGEVLTPDSLLNIIGNFIHLQIEEKEDWEGRKYKKAPCSLVPLLNGKK
jgi:hypothetical protein